VGPAAGVVRGEEHLADPDAVPGEGRGVAGDQQALPDTGGGLLARQVLGPSRQPERGEPGGDGTAGDQHDLLRSGVARLPSGRLRRPAADRGQHVHQGVDPVGVEAPGGGGE
jgi:hypothetical protein